jgi:branched-chain amino acid transport system ATP-binding protein
MLEIRHLSARYQAREPVLRGVELEADEAGVVALLGSNGAGKTSLMRAISGTIGLYAGSVIEGRVRFAGEDITGADPARIAAMGLAQVPEGRRVFTSLSVDENLDAGAYTTRSTAVRERRREEVFDLFPRLSDRRRQPAGTLSGGEQQMLAMGRALMSGPRMLLLDEPSLGLAPQLVDLIARTITDISAGGVPVLLVEQNAAMALRISRRAYVLDLGATVLEGRSEDLASSDEVQRLYLGESSGLVDAAEPDLGTGAASAPTRTLERWSA